MSLEALDVGCNGQIYAYFLKINKNKIIIILHVVE